MYQIFLSPLYQMVRYHTGYLVWDVKQHKHTKHIYTIQANCKAKLYRGYQGESLGYSIHDSIINVVTHNSKFDNDTPINEFCTPYNEYLYRVVHVITFLEKLSVDIYQVLKLSTK